MSKKPYVLTRAETVAVMSTVAVNVAVASNVTHPDDLASPMIFAIEYAAETLAVLKDRGLIDWER